MRCAPLAVALVLALCAPAWGAVERGVQDDGMLAGDPAALFSAGHELGARWVRMIVNVGDPSAPARIRAAHAEGFKVLLTVGGSGTPTLRPTRAALASYLRTLPRADRYTVVNEPDLSGMKPCTYRWTWLKLRHMLGARLLWGDFSPWHPLTYTAAARRCGAIPHLLRFALHPYCRTSPLAPCLFDDGSSVEGGIGNLGYARRWLRAATGSRLQWWLDEFSYIYDPTTSSWRVTDEQAAAMWPMAEEAARRAHAAMLGLYMPQGPTWDSRPRPLAWCVLAGACRRPDAPLPASNGPRPGSRPITTLGA